MKNKSFVAFSLLGLLISISACQDDICRDENYTTSIEVDSEGSSETAAAALAENEQDHEDEENDYSWDSDEVTTIELTDSSATVTGDGVEVNESLITIINSGNYLLSGTLSDGQVRVDTEDEEVVRLIFNGVDITNTSNAPVSILSATKVILVLMESTENYLTDGSHYVFDKKEEDRPNATLFSKEDLTIYGEGSLIIDANYNDGINSKDGLIIKSGNLKISAVDDGIRGKDYLVIKDGNIQIEAKGDGLKSDNVRDESLGYIAIENGDLTISSGKDAIQAETDVIIFDGIFQLTSGGGSDNDHNSPASRKGIKAETKLVIDNGNFTIQSADDALHSDKSISINNGTFEISSGDDGIHADMSLGIHGGTITIDDSYEGIEGAIIILNDGKIEITAEEDGLNVSGGNDGLGTGFPGLHSSSEDYYLYINGGTVLINAQGDGIDVNGNVEMTGGTVVINGPTSDSDGILDYEFSFTITGGNLIGTGSNGKPQTPGSNSTQNSLLVNFETTLDANTLVNIQTSEGESLLTIQPSKEFECLIYSSSDLITGNTYSLYYGGSSSGDFVNGILQDGEYSGGTLFADFTVSDLLTTVSN